MEHFTDHHWWGAEKGKQREQIITLAEKQEIADQDKWLGHQSQWEEMAQELSVKTEQKEVFNDD